MREPLLLLSLLLSFAGSPSNLYAQGKTLVERGSPLQVVEPDEGERALRMTPVVKAVQRAQDSVVSIYLQNQLAQRQPVTEGQGSGVLLDDSGLVITNWHVIAPVLLAEQKGRTYGLLVKLRDGRERKARILSSSKARDLALLQLQLKASEQVKPIEIGRSADLMIGETVIAIGNPQGHANTVTSGVLSAIGRSIQVRAPDGIVREYKDLMQTDAAINQGNSGGALLDITGRLVGINNAMSASAENIGFAIPMDIVRDEFQQQLLQSTNFVTSGNAPWLGIEVADNNGQVIVSEVIPGGPAHLAGVRTGDILTKIGQTDIRSSIDYLRHFFELNHSRAVDLHIDRGSDASPGVTRVKVLPITRSEGVILTGIGARLSEIAIEQDQAVVRKATMAFYRGSGLRSVRLFPAVLRLEDVLANSPADATGLEKGDLLLGIVVPGRFGDRELPINTHIDLARLIEKQQGENLRFIILRGDRDLIGTIKVRGEAKGKR